MLHVMLHKKGNKSVAVKILIPRWMCGGTKLDQIRNEYITGSLRLSNVASKTIKNRLRWFRYRNDDEIVMAR